MDWSGFVPDVISTFAGAFLGAGLAWLVAVRQFQRETVARAERDRQVAADLQDQIRLELRDNIASARQAADALGTSGAIGADGWRLASTMAEPITDRFHHDLVNSGLLKYVSERDRKKYYATYRALQGLKDRVKAGEVVLNFGGPQVSSVYLDGTRKAAQSVLDFVSRP